jgi:hypothetical protein
MAGSRPAGSLRAERPSGARLYSQQQQPLHFPQHGPSVQPHAQVHFGSSQQQAASWVMDIVSPMR